MAKIKIKKKTQIEAPVTSEETSAEIEAVEEEAVAEECAPCEEEHEEEEEVIEVEEGEPVSLPLPELFQFKVLHFMRKETEALTAVRGPIVEEFNKRLASALQESEVYQKASKEKDAAVVEARSHFSEILPEGYVVTSINLDDATVTAEFKPELSGESSE